MVATWLGFGVSLPLVIHAIVCLLGAFAGGAALGWIVGELKARTGAHEVIVTIMLNYVMYYFLSYLLGTPTAMQRPGQTNLISPIIAPNAQLPHVGGLAACGSTSGFLHRAGGRGGRVVAADPQHDRLRVPHRRREPERGPQRRA